MNLFLRVHHSGILLASSDEGVSPNYLNSSLVEIQQIEINQTPRIIFRCGRGLLLKITNYNDDFSPDLLSANIFYINFPFQGKCERSNNDDGEDENKH